MTWRCANRRKGRRLELAAVDYLGDVASEPLLPMRPVYMPEHSARCWSCRKTHRATAMVGAAAFSVLCLVYVAMLFSATP